MSAFVTLQAPPRPGFLPVAPPNAAWDSVPRQRAKLWDLNPSVHCSVIGTCLTTAELRSAMGKVLQRDVAGLSDHELHTQAVGLAGQHGAAAKLLHKSLDRRHQLSVSRFGKLRGEPAVLGAWAEAVKAGDIPGAYWAVLTHPDLGHAGLKRAFGDVHMLSHLVGAANRADIRRLAALEAENASLAGRVERQQRAIHEAITTRDAIIARLEKLIAGRLPDQGGADEERAALRQVVASQDAKLASETGRRERLETRLAEMSGALHASQRRSELSAREVDELRAELAAVESAEAEHGSALQLPVSRILYVGGRPGTVVRARDLLEAAGGVLLVHDGGMHDNPALLPGLIGQSQHVMFPVDCISHDAALAIKRLCRQSGKAWTALRSSGLGSFMAALYATDQAEETSPCAES